MKVVWVSHSPNIGGAELCLLEAVSGLVARGHDIHVVLPAHGPLGERLTSVGVSVRVMSYNLWMHTGKLKHPIYYRARRAINHFRHVAELAAFLRELRPDVLVTNTVTIPVGALAAKRAGVPHVWYIHEFGREDHHAIYDYSATLSLYLTDKLSNKVIVNSKAVAAKYRQYVPAHKMRLIYYAVEVDAPVRAVEERGHLLKLVLVGRKAPGKRQEDAIRALSLLVKKGLNIRLNLVGEEIPAYRTFLQTLSAELGVENLIEFVDFTDEPLSHVAAADVALMCSGSEAFGRVTVEAMKMGKPVVGARSGGTTELIEEGVNGLLYEPGKAEDLAAKLETLYYDRASMKEMGRNARAWSTATFNTHNYITGIENVLTEVCEPIA